MVESGLELKYKNILEWWNEALQSFQVAAAMQRGEKKKSFRTRNDDKVKWKKEEVNQGLWSTRE